jgi:hypothetical protein
MTSRISHAFPKMRAKLVGIRQEDFFFSEFMLGEEK